MLDKTAVVDFASKESQRQIDALREYRIRLTTDVVTGKLDVREVALPAILGDDLLADEEIDGQDETDKWATRRTSPMPTSETLIEEMEPDCRHCAPSDGAFIARMAGFISPGIGGMCCASPRSANPAAHAVRATGIYTRRR